MAFTDQEKQLIIWGKQNGKTPEQVSTAIAKLRAGIQPTPAPEAPANSVAEDVAIGAAKGAGSTVKTLGDLAASALPTTIAGPIAGSLPTIRDRISSVVQPIKDKIQGALGLTDKNLEATNTAQKVGKGVELAAELATPFVTTKLAAIAPDIIKVDQSARTALPKAGEAVEYAKGLINPKNTPAQAVAQIGQGATRSLSSVAKTLETIDTTKIKTYQDFLQEINATIPKLADTVDAQLAADTNVYKLADLAVSQKTTGGQIVKTDYVSRAIEDLKQLYTATGEDVARANIEEIAQHAKTTGLTRKEVNDISRVYGQEFGSKAFSKTGDPLTGTNAQAFETTRSGLKDVARQGLGGKAAQEADAKLSALYDTRKLVEKNVEAVAKLQQRIQERGLIEKAGYYVAKYADIMTGGSIRGFVGGVLPRGAGYKTMNALDIEKALRANLDVIEKALAENTDKGLLEVLKNADPVFKTGATPKTQ